MKDLIEAYVHASKGSRERALLLALDAGYDFAKVVVALGDDGVRIAFKCITNGWIDQGQITPAGRALLQSGSDA